MINRIKNTINYRLHLRALKRQFEPRPEFLNETKRMFLAEVAKRRVAPYAPHIGWHAIFLKAGQYAIAIVIVAFAGTTSLVAFADMSNVQPTHPLYGFKRLSEHVRLTMAPKERQNGLYAEFAQRRATEALAMREVANTETDGVREQHEEQIKTIKKDFQKNIEALEAEPAVAASLSPASVRGLCETKEKIERDGGFESASDKMSSFDRQCDAFLHPEEATQTATTTIGASQDGTIYSGDWNGAPDAEKVTEIHHNKKLESE